MDQSGEVVSGSVAHGVLSQATITPTRSLLRRWLREPLLHFLLIGGALFCAYSVLHPRAGYQLQSNRIVLTEDDLNQLAIAWSAQWQRSPTPEEVRGLVEGRVREEVLYREAIALGLDQNDTIVKRRLAQKMEFLAEDVSGLRDPSSSELRAWFEANRARFARPARVSFRHVFFSLDRRGESAEAAAARALEKLTGKPADASGVQSIGDHFMFQDYYAEREPEQIASVFGQKFANSLFQLEPGAWQGPRESGLGWHLIFVVSNTPKSVPAFEEIEANVKSEWISDQRANAKRKAFEAMRVRYEVVLPTPTAKEESGGRVAQAKDTR
jgi:peptidyl-prolyl cis-trans isomerase C